jgi:hypothetical protein
MYKPSLSPVDREYPGEERIVWLEHPENFRYVRESSFCYPTRMRRPSTAALSPTRF